MNSFREHPVQNAAIEWFKKLGYLQLDWTKKEEAKSAITLAVKRELRDVVPFSEMDKLLKELIEQAEGQYSEWPLVG